MAIGLVVGLVLATVAAVGDDEATVLERGNLTRDGWDARAYRLLLTSGPEPGGERLDAESLAVVFDPSLDVNDPTDDGTEDTETVSTPACTPQRVPARTARLGPVARRTPPAGQPVRSPL